MRENEGGLPCDVDGCHDDADPVSGGWRMCAMHYQREVRSRAGKARTGNDVPFPVLPLTPENAARLFDLVLAEVLEFEGPEAEYQQLVARLREVGWKHGQAVRRLREAQVRHASRVRVRARKHTAVEQELRLAAEAAMEPERREP